MPPLPLRPIAASAAFLILAGCAADGESYQEALENVETVIAEWIDTARQLGRPVPEPKGGRVMHA
ncbi:MAG: type II toxin-antitoxin system HicB family antitoxin [Longimicrobiales bacterium]